MLNKIVKYSLVLSFMFGLTACTTGRTITVSQPTTPVVKQPSVVTPTKQPSIKEEILLGQNSGLLGDRIDVPTNNPILGNMIDDYGDINNSMQELPGENSVIERIPFPIEEYKRVPKRGSHTVSGTVYLENSHSSLQIKGKKVKLWLNPVTSYSIQWYEVSYLGGYKLSKTDKRLFNYLKFTYSNDSGKFNFFGVPAGDYYLTGTISCGQECGYGEEKSIRLVREISVGRGVTSVDLMKHVP
jgi:hypothetical protein